MLSKDFQFIELRNQVLNGTTRSMRWRRQQLDQIGAMISNHENEILNALNTDLGKPPTEAFFEIVALKQELNLAIQQLSKWMQPRKVQVPITFKPGEAMVQLEPLGCVLIIGPWNYPFSLTIQPLISAIAAGNTAVLKPSEQAPATSALIAQIIPKYLLNNFVQVIEGDGDVASKLVEQSFDHIFFTGNGTIGKKVLGSAAKNLTPVTLELGGQSPAVVIKGADLEITAKRLMWGKSVNAGQTCIAPNHLLVEEQMKKSLVHSLKEARDQFYGIDPIASRNLSRIINKKQFNRLKILLEEAKKNGKVLLGGEINEDKNLIATTLIEVEDANDPLMEEELFGPLLPIMSVKNLASAINEIKKKPKPLAIYLFGGTPEQQELVVNTTTSGGVCLNDVVMQAGVPNLPFGGVGASGMGRYHGLAGFETFSHHKSIFKRPFWLDLKFRYPPYSKSLGLIKSLLS